MYKITIPRRTPWSKNRLVPKVNAAHTDFSEIVVDPAKKVDDMDFHEQRMLAKGRGVDRLNRVESVNAANVLVKAALYNPDGIPTEHVYKVYEDVVYHLSPAQRQTKTTVYIPTIVREKRENDPEIPGEISKNALATVYALELAQALEKVSREKGDKVSFMSSPQKRMLRLDSDIRLPRREADIFQRFSRQNVYTARHFKSGDLVIIADDHVEQGASIKSQIDTLEQHGASVVGIASFGALKESLNLCPNADEPFIAQMLYHNKRIKKDDRTIQEMKIELEAALNLSGLSLDSLTSRELLSLISLFVDDSSKQAVDFFNNMKRVFGVSDTVEEGDRNSLAILDKPAISVSDFYREMRINQIMEAIMSRQPNISTREEQGLVSEDDVKPFVLISAGGPAVGKSRIVDILGERQFFPAKTLFVSASMFEDCFTDQDFMKHFHPELLPEHYDTYKEAISRLGQWGFDNGYCFVWEDHFQDIEWTKSIVNASKLKNYEAYAIGLFLDEATHKKHREDHGQIDETTPESMRMMVRFAQNWEQLMSSGIFNHARLFHRVKPVNAPDWKIGTEERIVNAAEYIKEGDEVACVIHPTKSMYVKEGNQVIERKVDAYEIFQRWQRLQINESYYPGRWEDLVEGEGKELGYFSGRMVDLREENTTRSEISTRLEQVIQPRI